MTAQAANDVSTSGAAAAMLPIAIDVMGGDNAPDAILEGARLAAAEGIPMLLVGLPEVLDAAHDLPGIAASEVIAMDADPGRSVRRMKDSSLVRAAEAVRDGTASAMLSAGNTGATMASALLRMGRLKGVARPAIATPIPVPGGTPTVLLDAGANTECQPEWLVQFAQMGVVYARERFGVAEPRVALLANGEEETKGSPLGKATQKLMTEGWWNQRSGGTFIGNVEGRDLMTDDVEVVVTDGFTGNVALKALEGSLRTIAKAVLALFDKDEQTRAAADVLAPGFLELYASLDPEGIGGAMLLGTDGICIISHGSSSPVAMLNASRVARDLVQGGILERLADAIVQPPAPDVTA
jgi:glycerol-3-phosphate acyltransferase PlsX